MDSRPQDDFVQPEPTITDDAAQASRAVVATNRVLPDASGEAIPDSAGANDLDDTIDDLEFELASLLMPDLDAIDLNEAVADTAASGISYTQDDAEMSEPDPVPAATIEQAAGEPIDEAIIAGQSETSDMPSMAALALTESEASAVDMDVMPETDVLELELALDAMAADMMVDEPEAAVGEIAVPEERPAIHVETIVASRIQVVAELTEFEMVAADGETRSAAMAMPAVVETSADDTVVTSGQATDAAAADLLAEAPDAAIENVQGDREAPEPVLVEAMVASKPDAPADQTLAGDTRPTELEARPETSDLAPAEAIVVPQPASAVGDGAPATETGLPLEAQTFEQALEAQDILATGFEAAVRSAADRSESRFLFQMPVHTVADCQRVAAVNLPGDDAPKTVLVLLRADGRSYRMEDARESDNPFAGMAVSYGGLLAHLKSLPARAAA